MGCGASSSSKVHVVRPMRPPEIHPDATVQEILEVMRCYPQLAGLQEEALTSLGVRVANDEEFVRKFVAEHGGPTLVASMRNHAGHPGVQGHACGAMYNLALSPPARSQLTTAGATHEVLSAMRNFSSVIAVQHRCLAALSNLTLDFAAAQELEKEHGVTAIVAAMKAHPEHAGLQEAACFVICSLTSHRDARLSSQVTEQGGISQIVGCLRAHQPETAGLHIGVQAKACLALFNLAESEESCRAIVEAGGVEAVLCALRQYGGELTVQEAGCAVLAALAEGSAEHSRRVAGSGGVAVVVAGMGAHLLSAALQSHGARALHFVAAAASAEDARAQLSEEVGAAVVAGMGAHLEVAAVQRSGCGALAALAGHPHLGPGLHAGGAAAAAAAAALELHAEEHSVVAAAAAMMQAFAQSPKKNTSPPGQHEPTVEHVVM